MENEDLIIKLLQQLLDELRTANKHLDRIENQTFGY